MTDTHYRQWLDRYGDIYPTDAERRAAYADARAALAELRAVFGA